jgi:hypothetical protein
MRPLVSGAKIPGTIGLRGSGYKVHFLLVQWYVACVLEQKIFVVHAVRYEGPPDGTGVAQLEDNECEISSKMVKKDINRQLVIIIKSIYRVGLIQSIKIGEDHDLNKVAFSSIISCKPSMLFFLNLCEDCPCWSYDTPLDELPNDVLGQFLLHCSYHRIEGMFSLQHIMMSVEWKVTCLQKRVQCMGSLNLSCCVL